MNQGGKKIRVVDREDRRTAYRRSMGHQLCVIGTPLEMNSIDTQAAWPVVLKHAGTGGWGKKVDIGVNFAL
jgi:hypothetical protein